MFERFTEQARRTVVAAQEEARRLDHDYIGTEHLLLGLLTETDAIAARALRSFGLAPEPVRADIEGFVGRGMGSTPGHIPFTARSKKVLELSLREALTLGHNYIGTEHILLGIVREAKGVAAQILVQRGATLDKLREAVLAELDRGGVVATPVGPKRRTPGAEEAFAAAADLAGSGPVGTQHFLEALARSPDSLAGKALAAFGFDADALAAKLDELGMEGTTDVTPEDQAARAVQIHVEGEEVHLLLHDPATLELARSISETLGGPIRGDDPAVRLVALWQGVLDGLEGVQRQLKPAATEESETGRSAIVRKARQSRLARRRLG